MLLEYVAVFSGVLHGSTVHAVLACKGGSVGNPCRPQEQNRSVFLCAGQSFSRRFVKEERTAVLEVLLNIFQSLAHVTGTIVEAWREEMYFCYRNFLHEALRDR